MKLDHRGMIAISLLISGSLHAQSGIPSTTSVNEAGQTVETTIEPRSETRSESREEKLRKLRAAMRGDSTKESPKSSKDKIAKEVDQQDLWLRAQEELKPKPTAYSEGYFVSSAVVRTRIIGADDPVYNHGLQLGLTLQPYSPRGRVPMVTLGENNLDKADSTWMPGIEFRYMPWVSKTFGEHGVGLRFGAAYIRQDTKVYGPTGLDLGETKIHSLHTFAFLSQEWIFRRSKYWSWTADLGVSRFDLIQTGQNSLAEASDYIWSGVFRTGPSFRSGSFAFSLEYERRQRISAGKWAALDPQAFILGIHYGLR